MNNDIVCFAERFMAGAAAFGLVLGVVLLVMYLVARALDYCNDQLICPEWLETVGKVAVCITVGCLACYTCYTIGTEIVTSLGMCNR